MKKTGITINANNLFPVEKLKEYIKEALAVTDTLGPAIITKGNRPAYALIRLNDIEPEAVADRIKQARDSAKGSITTEYDKQEKI